MEEPRELTAQEVWDIGEEIFTKATIDSQFIPRFGDGARIYGEFPGKGGKWVIDMSSGIGVNCLGYRKEVPKPKSNLVMMPGNEWHNEPKVLLGLDLCRIVPILGRKKVFLCNSGTESVGCAMKMGLARRKRQLKNAADDKARFAALRKRVFAAFNGAFHGRMLDALALNCSKEPHTAAFFEDGGDLSDGFALKNRGGSFSVRHLMFPERGDAESIRKFNEMLDIYPWHDTISFFVELVQGEGGIRVIDAGSLHRLADLCAANDVCLVADEVQTGMMRIGKMFACEHFGIHPDIICLSKALGGGLAAVGAVIAREEFDFDKPGMHSNTFGGSPYPCQVARETIRALEELGVSYEFEERIRVLADFAPEGLGLMRRIVFPTPEERNEVCDLALEREGLGVLVIPAGVRAMRLMPPLNIPMDDLKLGIEILKTCMAEARCRKLEVHNDR